MKIEAVVFDFVGTLVNIVGYSYEGSIEAMYRSLVRDGLNVDFKKFCEVYEQSREKYREIRYKQLVEVTNAVWLAEALNNLGFERSYESPDVKKAVNIFFKGYLRAIKPKRCTVQVLTRLSKNYKLGLISNFTYAPIIYAALRKFKLNGFFNCILVSHDVGYRKPNPKIFKRALEILEVEAGKTVYVGDSPKEDIRGAKKMGMKTVFLTSQFFGVDDLKRENIQPDIILHDLCKLPQVVKTRFNFA
jgi:putative hydrolase of the HAD superfamily